MIFSPNVRELIILVLCYILREELLDEQIH